MHMLSSPTSLPLNLHLRGKKSHHQHGSSTKPLISVLQLISRELRHAGQAERGTTIIMVASLFRPWMIMSMSVFYLMVTVVKLIVKGDLATLLSWEAFNDAWFGNFWTTMGPMSKSEGEPWVEPLLAGRVRAGRVTEKAGSGESPISGVVLEVGAGSGMWTDVLSGIVRSSAAVDKIYGVEPNPISAAALRQRVEKVGLAGTYEVVPVGIEDLADEADIGPGSVDCIVTVQCLCSIPEPQKNIRMLYDYLKEGGRWYVYEHVRNDNGGAVSLVQRTYCVLLRE